MRHRYGKALVAGNRNVSNLSFRDQQDLDAFYDALIALRDSRGYKQAFHYPLTDMDLMREILDASVRFSVRLARADAVVFDHGVRREDIEELIAVLNMDIETLNMGELRGQYDLTLRFTAANGRVGTITLRFMDERCFERTLGFLFD